MLNPIFLGAPTSAVWVEVCAGGGTAGGGGTGGTGRDGGTGRGDGVDTGRGPGSDTRASIRPAGPELACI
jgi:hypothetical protein